MSYLCGKHGWQHLLKECPSCQAPTIASSSATAFMTQQHYCPGQLCTICAMSTTRKQGMFESDFEYEMRNNFINLNKKLDKIESEISLLINYFNKQKELE